MGLLNFFLKELRRMNAHDDLTGLEEDQEAMLSMIPSQCASSVSCLGFMLM